MNLFVRNENTIIVQINAQYFGYLPVVVYSAAARGLGAKHLLQPVKRIVGVFMFIYLLYLIPT